VTAWPVEDDDRDPVLDACLAEVLGGVAPPDLSDRILTAWKARQDEALRTSQPAPSAGTALLGAGDSSPKPAGGPFAGQRNDHGNKGESLRGAVSSPSSSRLIATASPRHVSLRSGAGGALSETRRTRPLGYRWVTIAASLVVGIGLGLLALQRYGPVVDTDQKLAETELRETPGDDLVPPDGRGPERPSPQSIAGRALEDRRRDEVAGQDERDRDRPRDAAPRDFRPARPDVVPFDQPTLVSHVNQTLEQLWLEHNVQPSDAASDREWFERTFHYLLGRAPVTIELETFLNNPDPGKRQKWVEYLHTNPEHVHQYALHWARVLATAWLGPPEAFLGNSAASRVGLELYLRDSLLANRSLQQIVYELLTAEGSGQPMAEDYRGAVNFLLAHHSPDGVAATAAVSRRFMGQRLDCAQCHDHPFYPEWTQQKFWELNAFFRQLHVEVPGEGLPARLMDRDAADEVVFFEEPSGYQRAVYPVLPNGETIPSSRLVADVKRRAYLGRWIASSDEFAQATVNRVWAHFFSFGLVHPVDDLGPHNPPVDPVLLDTLTDQFIAHGYRLPVLTRWIVSSDAFQRSTSVNEQNIADAPEQGDTPLFSRFYYRPAATVAAWDALQQLVQLRSEPGGIAEQARREGLLRLSRLLTPHTAGEEGASEVVGDTEILLPSAVLGQAASQRAEARVLQRILQSEMSLEEKIQHLFGAAIGRQPLPRERAMVQKMLDESPEPATVLQDVWWALLFSQEFLQRP
jgi:hypothetical protein